MTRTLIQLFAKAPVKGQVKTRLARELGADKALSVYLHCLKHNLSLLQSLPFDYQLWLNKSSDHPLLVGESPLLQKGSDLGEKMYNALSSELSRNCYQRVMLMGSDCLEFSEQILQKASQQLDDHELVLVPAEDGGYVLIAARDTINKQIFEDIDWGSDQVLMQTLQRATQTAVRTRVLNPLRDIDHVADLQHYAAFEHLL